MIACFSFKDLEKELDTFKAQQKSNSDDSIIKVFYTNTFLCKKKWTNVTAYHCICT